MWTGKAIASAEQEGNKVFVFEHNCAHERRLYADQRQGWARYAER